MATQVSHFPRSKHSELFLNPFFSPYFPSNALTNPVVLPLKHIQILVFFYTFWSKFIINTDQDICNSHLVGLPAFFFVLCGLFSRLWPVMLLKARSDLCLSSAQNIQILSHVSQRKSQNHQHGLRSPK